jgi:hypothetical protein
MIGSAPEKYFFLTLVKYVGKVLLVSCVSGIIFMIIIFFPLAVIDYFLEKLEIYIDIVDLLLGRTDSMTIGVLIFLTIYSICWDIYIHHKDI